MKQSEKSYFVSCQLGWKQGVLEISQLSPALEDLQPALLRPEALGGSAKWLNFWEKPQTAQRAQLCKVRGADEDSREKGHLPRTKCSLEGGYFACSDGIYINEH